MNELVCIFKNGSWYQVSWLDKGTVFTKVSKHLGVSRQAVWFFCHKPYTETLDLKLRTIKSVADIQGTDLASLTKRVIELDNNIKDNNK